MSFNIDEILFRCSSLGHLMVEPRSKSESISETTKTHLVDVFVSNKYNRFTDSYSKFFDKGNETEENSITIVSLMTRQLLKKNKEWIKNEFLSGTPDLFIGESINSCERIRDTKSSWDIYSFNRAKAKGLNEMYKWQGTGYMALTGANVCNIDYCLNNTPWHLVEGELRKESYRQDSGDTPTWIELQIIANHCYDLKTFNNYISLRGISAIDDNSKAVVQGFVEVPLEERYFSFEFKRDENEIEKLYNKIKNCREWIKSNLL
jgi:hypothetical protein